MFKLPFSQQRKQKILNYEIKLIEQCSDSLFNSSNPTHQRYLQWNLYSTLRSLLPSQSYTLRWMGNDRHSYIYSYFYIAITACSKHPSAMVELKSVLYELAEKYLSQYEQKLLIQFLCLIEYSQEKYLFFRKYAKIENILLKLFQEIQHRNRTQGFKSMRTSIQEENNFSKLTTCITSPCRSAEKEEREEGKAGKGAGDRPRRFVGMFEIYNRYFRFVKIEYLCENIMRFSIALERVKESGEFYVCVEKECFFVVEVKPGSNSVSRRSCSIIEEEREYLRALVEKEKEKKTSKKQSRQFQSKKSSNDLQFTPKFISDKKKRSQQFYSDHHTNKNINIQVLEVQQFQQKQIIPQSPAPTAVLQYTSKIDNLGNIKNTIKSIDLDKTDPFLPHNLHAFGAERKAQTEQTIHHRNHKHTHHNQPSKGYIPGIKKHTSFKDNTLLKPAKMKEGTTTGYDSTKRINPEQIRSIHSGNFSRETLLSANNLKRFNKHLKPMMVKMPTRQFHSHSPRNRLAELRPTSGYAPFVSPLKPRLPLQCRQANRVKFTYQ